MHNKLLIFLFLIALAVTQSGCIGTIVIVTSLYRKKKANQIKAEQVKLIEEREMNGQ